MKQKRSRDPPTVGLEAPVRLAPPQVLGKRAAFPTATTGPTTSVLPSEHEANRHRGRLCDYLRVTAPRPDAAHVLSQTDEHRALLT